MIIVNLKGGLGNQMFQYAAGRALSLRNNDTLKLDTSSLSKANELGNIYRPFSLQNFNIINNIALEDEVKNIKGNDGKIVKLVRKIVNKYYLRHNIAFHKSIYNLKGNVYLDGYFQSEKYFNDFSDEIRKDFTLKDPLREQTKKWADRINNDDNSISIHIRRGDYVTHRDFGKICTKEYFEDAINFIKERINNPNFYVFSDDISWVKDNINFSNSVNFVSEDKLSDFEDLYLMSKCKHNILSNSSFSWWGAWLNSNKNKIIITPKRWANLSENDFRDIVPDSWIRV